MSQGDTELQSLPVVHPWEVPRIHELEQDPRPGAVWRYTPKDLDRLAEDVLKVTENGSFVGRILRVITNHGQSKNFEEITGQDGLTFGITDFAGNSGCCSFFKHFREQYPEAYEQAFGEQGGCLVDQDWVDEHNGGGKAEGNNVGLIRFLWLRKGLSVLLSDRRFRGFQLAHFVRGKVNPCEKTFREVGFEREFSLAAMIGIANSYGPGGMRKTFLQPALDAVSQEGRARENAVIERMLRRYVEREMDEYPQTQVLLKRGFGEQEGDFPAGGKLGHRGRRLKALFEVFPYGGEDAFAGVGRFSLAKEECFAEEGATCWPEESR